MTKKLPAEVQQTIERIQELAARREEYLRRTGQILFLPHLCNKLGIYRTAVKRLAPELYDNWSDINFHWDGQEMGLRDASAAEERL